MISIRTFVIQNIIYINNKDDTITSKVLTFADNE